MFKIGSLGLLMGLAASAAFAQGVTVPQGSLTTTIPPAIVNRSFTVPVFPAYNMGAVTGAPYTADLVGSTVRTLADGGHITNENPTKRMYRDSQGRTRTERAMGIARPGTPPMPVVIEVRDPVAGVAYILDAVAKVAHRVKLQAPPGGADRPPRTVSPAVNRPTHVPVAVSTSSVMSNGVETKNEYLGIKMFDGVEAEGRRTTTTFPAGYNGADRPISTVSEHWSSPYFETSVLSITNDPRMGQSVSKLINISLIEPDPALFMPPVDYTVVDEPGTQVKIAVPAQ